MANYCYCVPILPGGEEKMKQWNKNDITDSASHDRVFHEAGISREQVWVQRTPMGDFAVVSFEVESPEKAFRVIATSTDPWAARFRDLLKQAHGVDVKQPMQMNELLVNWKVVETVKA